MGLGSDRVVINPSQIMRIAGTVTWPCRKTQDCGYVPELGAFIAQGTPPVASLAMQRVANVETPSGVHPLSLYALTIAQSREHLP